MALAIGNLNGFLAFREWKIDRNSLFGSNSTSETPIKILIVDDIPETRENLKKLLAFEPDMDVIGLAGTGKEAVELAQQLAPEIILMDINMPDMDGIAASEQITAKYRTSVSS